MPRVAAWEILRSGAPAPLRAVDSAVRRHALDERDARLLRRLVGTEVRRRGTLRAIARSYSYGKLKPDLSAHLHLGLVQLLFLDRVPDHAALSETADAVSRTLGHSKVRVTNGILRTVLRERMEGHAGDPRRDLIGTALHLERSIFHDPAEHPLLWAEDALSIPAPLIKRWTKRFGRERAEELGLLFLAEPPLCVRVDVGEREAVQAQLRELGVETLAAKHPRVLLFRPAARASPQDDEEPAAGGSLAQAGAGGGALFTSELFRSGQLSIQGEHALAAAELVGAQAGERVLDLCAAPGGKSAVLAASGARVYASDVAPHRLRKLTQSSSRLGSGERIHAFAADGASALLPDVRFDAVLIDAPCSNTAVLGARPAARWRFGPGQQKSLTKLQGRLMDEGAAHVIPGGRLVWSTCSLEPEENERQVRDFLERHAGWELEAELCSVPSADGPFDGGYAARLRAPAAS